MRTALVASSLILLCAGSGRAQSIGERIVVTAESGQLKSENDLVGRVPKGNILVVKEVEGEWFWVTWSSGKVTTKGWINRRDVIAFDKALDFFNDELKKNPNARLFNIRGMFW